MSLNQSYRIRQHQSASKSPANENSTASARRNRVAERKRPIVAATPTPERKRTTTIAKTRRVVHTVQELNFADLPVLALKRVFFHLGLKDRLALGRTCKKLREIEKYSCRHRCTLNVRLDLMCTYKDYLQQRVPSNNADAIFGSTELFHGMMRRSIGGQSGSVCSMEKIATIDFGPPKFDDGTIDRAGWGGRVILSESSLRNWFGECPTRCSLIEMYLHHCYVSVESLNAAAEIFVGLEKLSVSLKALQFPAPDTKTADLDARVIGSVANWSSLVNKKKKMTTSVAVKEMIMHVYKKFASLEIFLIYDN